MYNQVNLDFLAWFGIGATDPLTVNLLVVGIGLVLGLVVRIVLQLLFRFTRSISDRLVLRSVTSHVGGPLFMVFPLLFITMGLAALPEETTVWGVVKIANVLFIMAMSWFFACLLNVFEDVLVERYDTSKQDNYKERKVRTQLQFIKKLCKAGIVIIAVGLILMSFRTLREFGTGLLASAGLAGIVLGFAAQKTLGNFLAGIQIAFTQPIKLDDAVIVEGDWGWIEEITLTYVIVKTWDWRRLVLPITYFVEKPFQNWTRQEADLLGSVFLYTDYRLPVEALRQELQRILENEPLWNGKASVLQVVDSTEHTMVLRALMSANNAPQAWDLRCSVREKLIDFLRQNYPGHFPVTRVLMEPQNSENGRSAGKNGGNQAPADQQPVR